MGFETGAVLPGARSVDDRSDRIPAPGRETLYFAYTDKHRAVRDPTHKLIEYVVGGRHSMTQLFDLTADPREQHNLLFAADEAARPEVAAKFARGKINIEYAYGSSDDTEATVFMRVSDTKKALEILTPKKKAKK